MKHPALIALTIVVGLNVFAFAIALYLSNLQPMLPMPPTHEAFDKFEKHMESCQICSLVDRDTGEPQMCEEAFRMLQESMKGDSNWTFTTGSMGWRYIGPPIDGWKWVVDTQEWEKK